MQPYAFPTPQSIKREFNVSQELVQNKNSLQFVAKVQPTERAVQAQQTTGVEKLHKKSQVTINLNNNTIDSSPALASSISALVVKLHQFAQTNRLRYTVARCLLDQVKSTGIAGFSRIINQDFFQTTGIRRHSPQPRRGAFQRSVR